MMISRNNRRPCFQCRGVGKVDGSVCTECRGYGSVTLMKLERARRRTNEGREPSQPCTTKAQG
jgi:DnaJ-class molecular chaperone